MSAVPERHGQHEPALEPGVCPVCGTPVAVVLDRCPECGLDLAGVPPRSGAYSRAAIVWTIVGLAAVYLVVLLAVFLDN